MEPFIGQIQCVGFNFAPVGWAKCDGTLLSIASNTALFSLLGTIYGGDGRTTFALPDLRGRVAIHEGSGPGLPSYSIGQRSGTATTTLTVANLPSHSHAAALSVSSANADTSSAFTGASLATPGQQSGRSFVPSLGYNSATPDQQLNGLNVGFTGGSTAFNNMQPYLTITWIIALTGIFPSRS
ncbi:phage tail protein [Gilvibacter sediminis]|uniref:phage tail protein n=1 Tax=Gilvibacter sediminis TaxID=379071 RepID=UPI002350B70A|nr:tail fiber protein [Gilvibacter sediminis]MDC7998580.1 tail fiber protein [Gilvibacter sediminis]